MSHNSLVEEKRRAAVGTDRRAELKNAAPAAANAEQPALLRAPESLCGLDPRQRSAKLPGRIRTASAWFNVPCKLSKDSQLVPSNTYKCQDQILGTDPILVRKS